MKLAKLAREFRKNLADKGETITPGFADMLAKYAMNRFLAVQNTPGWPNKQYFGLNELDPKRMIQSDGGQAVIEIAENDPRHPHIEKPRKDHPEEFPVRLADSEDYKKAKVIVWLGVDQTGRGYAYESLKDLEPLLAGVSNENPIPNVLTHIYSSNKLERDSLIENSILKGREVTTSAREIIKKYYVPRMLDDKGNFKDNPLEDGGMAFGILTHSYGGIVSKTIGNSIKELFKAKDKQTLALYGLENPLPYSDEVKEKMYREMQTVSIGFPLVIHTKEHFNPPYVNRINIMYEGDMGPHQPDFIRGLHEKFSTSTQPYHIIVDPNDSNRTMVWIKSGFVPNKVDEKINVIGHARACYTAALTNDDSPIKEIGDIAKRMLAGEKVNIAEELSEEKYKDKIVNAPLSKLEEWTLEADKKGNMKQLMNYMEQLYNEQLLWKETKLGGHPVLRENIKQR